MKKRILALVLGLGLSFSAFSQDLPVDQFDKRGIEVVNKFMEAIMSNQSDINAAAKKALPIIHRSEYNSAKNGLLADRMSYSFKKAWENAKFYTTPVVVTRVQKQGISAIGFKETAQSGTAYKVWISKKDGVAGLPAPLNVFFPADGSAPTMYYYGSL